MKSKLSLFLIFMIPLFSVFGQQKYPIQTIFKGDSVVMLTLKQSDNINKLIDNQESTLQKNSNEIDNLHRNIYTLKDSIKTLSKIITEYSKNKNTLEKNLNITSKDLITARDSLVYERKQIKMYRTEWTEMNNELNARAKDHRIENTLILIGTGIFTIIVTIFSGK